MVKEIFRTSVSTLNYDDHYNLVYLTWDCKGGMSFEKYREPFEFLLREDKMIIHGILSDIRKQSMVSTEMRSWLQKFVTPQARERGLKCYYVVSDANVFKKYYVNTIFQLLAGDSIERKMFKDFDEAEKKIKEYILKHLDREVLA